MRQVISVMYGLAEQGGGVTRVSLARTQALANVGYLSRLATLANDDKLDRTFETLVSQGRISSELNIVNFQRWFAHKAEMAMLGRPTAPQSTIEHLRVGVQKRVDYINHIGVKVVRYLTSSDYIFLEEFYDWQGSLAMITLSEPGKPVLKFNSLESVHSYWLELLSKECLPSFIIADAIQGADTVGMVESPDTYRILMMHSNHLMTPHTVGSRVAPKYDGVMRGIPYCDGLVVLTESQLIDLNEQFPSSRYTAIGNPIDIEESDVHVERERNLAVVVARLHSVKRIKNIIKAFVKVKALVPDAVLEIWGAGEQKEELQKVISDSGASHYIKMMGFAVDVSKIFRRARISLAMSVTEGFGVSFAESLAYGTPLVTMNTNYGPREIVTHGEDGFVVSTEKEFIEKVCLIFNRDDISKSMGDKGKVNVRRFSAESIAQLWVALFESLERKHRNIERYNVPVGEFITNSSASKLGWIYLPKSDVYSDPTFVGSFDKVVVCSVDKSKRFLRESTGLGVGMYEVDEMVFDAPKGIYRFRMMKGGVTYKGIVAEGAIRFIPAEFKSGREQLKLCSGKTVCNPRTLLPVHHELFQNICSGSFFRFFNKRTSLFAALVLIFLVVLVFCFMYS